MEENKKTAKHRTRRPRKEHFGEMIQMDGSIHDWFGTGKEVCLMNMVDDATGILRSFRHRRNDTSSAAMFV
ncbi:hypothetical protein [Thermospira aquatica]|uniref:Transposase n=1 Tax=Thermospira aquatica TaxID=2828656 RepID=A0AAX3BBB9_9SPIR|nr:hypothetical protein [Thermospira aquatica]URA09561.1 hypothetical protein KDW03_08695 [Thermospira aquatica]